ncbi:hypothetical protein BJV78DRAFT_1243568 [Lactifluus subvellereus]|nr:hypothetical protein BJV78DRAFT_1243568 [Lactifluus subvellereus]
MCSVRPRAILLIGSQSNRDRGWTGQKPEPINQNNLDYKLVSPISTRIEKIPRLGLGTNGSEVHRQEQESRFASCCALSIRHFATSWKTWTSPVCQTERDVKSGSDNESQVPRRWVSSRSITPYTSLNAHHTPTILLQSSSVHLLMPSEMVSSLRHYAHERLRPVRVAA